jgi:hypothetical protein
MVIGIDHIVYVTSNLEQSVDEFGSHLGIEIHHGGVHPEKGTHNALFRIGTKSYFEILAPLPDSGIKPEWLGSYDTNFERVSAICVVSDNLKEDVKQLSSLSEKKYEIVEGRRQTADQKMLQWKLGIHDALKYIDEYPFLIDWGNSSHPSATLESNVELKRLEIHAPDPDKVKILYPEIPGTTMIFKPGKPSISVTLQSPKGLFEIK